MTAEAAVRHVRHRATEPVLAAMRRGNRQTVMIWSATTDMSLTATHVWKQLVTTIIANREPPALPTVPALHANPDTHPLLITTDAAAKLTNPILHQLPAARPPVPQDIT